MDLKNTHKYNLDADIMQCRADIQKALGPAASGASALKQPSQPKPPKNAPDNPLTSKTAPQAQTSAVPKVSVKEADNRPTESRPGDEASLKSEIVALGGRIEHIVSELELRKNACRNNDSRLAEALQAIGQNDAKLTDLDKRVCRLSEEPLQSQEIEPLKTALAEIKNRLDSLALCADDVVSVRAGLETLSGRLQTAQKRLDDLNGSWSQTQRQIEKIHDRLSDYTNTLGSIEKRLQESQSARVDIDSPKPSVYEAVPEMEKEQPQDVSVPQFSLAEQNMAEHRRTVSTNRRGPSRRKTATSRDSVRSVVKQYIHPSAAPQVAHSPADKKFVPVGQVPTAQPVQTSAPAADPAAQRLLVQIVDRDIALFLSSRRTGHFSTETLRNN